MHHSHPGSRGYRPLHLAYFQDEKQTKCHASSPTLQIPSAYSGFFSRGPNNVFASGPFLLPLIPNCPEVVSTRPQLSRLALFSQEDRSRLLTDRRKAPVSFCLCLCLFQALLPLPQPPGLSGHSKSWGGDGLVRVDGTQVRHTSAQPSALCLASELRPLCLQSRYFTYWSHHPTPTLNSKDACVSFVHGLLYYLIF